MDRTNETKSTDTIMDEGIMKFNSLPVKDIMNGMDRDMMNSVTMDIYCEVDILWTH